MKVKNLTILFLKMSAAYANGNCFQEIKNKTFEHTEGIVGAKFPNSETPETIGYDKCLDNCLDMFECIGMTYEFLTSTCKLFKFIPNINIEKEKEINCQDRCITRFITVPKYCYDISNNIPVYVRFVNQLTDCYAFASLCKSNFRLQNEFEKLVNYTKNEFEKLVNDTKNKLQNMENLLNNHLDEKRGPPGLPGPKGDQGLQGPEGPKGYTGSPGSQGPRGYTGSQGSKGDRGYTGSQGSRGDRGYTGSQGPRGYGGEKGEKGELQCCHCH